jgi:iron complex outermembrane receptor protein
LRWATSSGARRTVQPRLPGQETGNVVALGYAVAFGSRNVNAIFAELYAPLLKNLEVTAAVRYDHYSDAGGTTNPKVGIKWTALALAGSPRHMANRISSRRDSMKPDRSAPPSGRHSTRCAVL